MLFLVARERYKKTDQDFLKLLITRFLLACLELGLNRYGGFLIDFNHPRSTLLLTKEDHIYRQIVPFFHFVSIK